MEVSIRGLVTTYLPNLCCQGFGNCCATWVNTRVSIDYEDISSVSSEVRPRKRKGNFGRNKHEKKLCTGIIFTDLFGVDT